MGKNQKESEKTTQKRENCAAYVVMSINICVTCGREIPEGMMICMACELGTFLCRCIVCDRPIAESDALCIDCREIIFRSKN